MLKNVTQLEVLIENKSYRFICDIDSPTTHCKEALFQFNKYIGQLEDQARSSVPEISEEPIKEDNLDVVHE